MRKPRNIKNIKLDKNGFYGVNPFASFSNEIKPLRVTLDGEFGIQDLEWIVFHMKRLMNVTTDK